MPTIFDVSKYIIEHTGSITGMKLQKLTYYVKAWGLVWDEEELFDEQFEALASGAVCLELYRKHLGKFKVDVDLFSDANSDVFTDDQKDTIDKVLEFYGQYTAQQLSDINHQESPWIDARGDCKPMDLCEEIITTTSMFEYYSGIWNGDNDDNDD